MNQKVFQDPPRPARGGLPWTEEENAQLKIDFLAGKSIENLAQIHQRSHGAVVSQLERLVTRAHLELTDPEEDTNQQRNHELVRAWQQLDTNSQQRPLRVDDIKPLAMPPLVSPAVRLARLFHETYERLAPSFSYQTRRASAKPWDEVPRDNQDLMIATAAFVLAELQRGGLEGWGLTITSEK